MTNDDERGEGGKKCRKFDDVICERPLREKNFSDFQTNLSPGIAMRFQRQKRSALHVIREGGLSLLGSHGKGTGARVSQSHCDAGVPVEVKIFLSQKIFSTFFKTGFLHVSGL